MICGVNIGGKDTLEEWGLMLCNDLSIGAAVPRYRFINIPEMSGALDLTEALTGSVPYDQRQITFTLFAVHDVIAGTRSPATEEHFQTVLARFSGFANGKRLHVYLPDNPDHYFVGRVSVGGKSGYNSGRVKVEVLADPYRIKDGETTLTVDDDDFFKTATPGALVTFDDGGDDLPMKSCVVSLVPEQDLNGYDSPWPGGGGKNKFDVSKLVNTADITVNNGAISVTGNAKNSTKKLSELADLVVGSTYTLTATVTGGSSTLIYLYGSNYSWTYGTQRTVTQQDLDSLVFLYGGNGTTAVLTEMMIRLASVTDAAFAPYSNICPISGHSGAELIRTGKNLAPKGYDNEITDRGVRITPTENGVKVVGTVTSRFALSLMSTSPSNRHVPLAAGEKVSFSLFVSGDISVAEVPFIGYYANNVYGGNIGNLRQESGYKLTWTVTEKYANADDSYVRAYVYLPANAVVDFEVGLMMELGSSATAYEPYQGDTYSVTFTDQGTVYGGTFDFVSGKLKVTKASVDLGTLNWQYESSGATRFFTDGLRSSIKYPADYDTAANAISSMYANRTYNQFATTERANGTMAVSSSGWLSVRDIAYADAATFKTAMSGVQFVYELATPLEYTLSAQQIETLLGENNVWSNDGDISELIYMFTDEIIINNEGMQAIPTINASEAGPTVTLRGASHVLAAGDNRFSDFILQSGENVMQVEDPAGTLTIKYQEGML